MGKKKQKRDFGVVYSTNPDFDLDGLEDPIEEVSSSNQVLRVSLDRKKRRGKAVTLVRGYKGHPEGLKNMGKLLKSKCGVGGTVKDGEIIIQGDHVQKVIDILMKEGHKNTKRSGG